MFSICYIGPLLQVCPFLSGSSFFSKMTDPCGIKLSEHGAGRGPLRVLELYAGIGGMHCALNRCFDFSRVSKPDEEGDFPFSSFEVVAAVDVNEVAASVYRHNFPSVNYLRKGVEGFTLTELEALRFNMVTMSPPCQPFTRQGLKMDEEDARTKSFFHFLSLLEKMAERGKGPSYVVVENVFGFESSSTHQTLIETLDRCGFRWREFLLTPTQFGIPNSRLRYFLIGKGGGGGGGERASEAEDSSNMTALDANYKDNTLTFSLSRDSSLSPLRDVPIEAQAFRHHRTLSSLNSEHNQSEPAPKRPKCEGNVDGSDVDTISEFLNSSENEGNKTLLVPDKVLKRFMVMDVTFPDSRRSCCFTKSYGKEMGILRFEWLSALCSIIL